MIDALNKPARALAAFLLGLPTIVRYVFVGGTAFVTDAGTLLLCIHAFRAPVWVATAIAFAVAFFVNFGLNRVLTFTDSGSRDGAMHIQTVKFTILVAINFFVTEGIMNALTLKAHMSVFFAKVLSTAFITLYNFYLYQHWVFGSDSMKFGKRAAVEAAVAGTPEGVEPDQISVT